MLLPICSLLLLLLPFPAACGVPRPPHTEHARLARWLTRYNTWGTLSTQGASGGPSGGVVSFADGPPSDGPAATLQGRLFFFLTPMDKTGHDIKERPGCALSIAEAQMPGGCGTTDPMDPTCARVSVLGTMLPVKAADEAAAAGILFDQHPAMRTWPRDHGFHLFELHIQELHLLDWYGGMHIVSPQEYFSVWLDTAPADSTSSRQGSVLGAQQLHSQQWRRLQPLLQPA